MTRVEALSKSAWTRAAGRPVSIPWTCFYLLPAPTIWAVVQMISLSGARERVVRRGEGQKARSR